MGMSEALRKIFQFVDVDNWTESVIIINWQSLCHLLILRFSMRHAMLAGSSGKYLVFLCDSMASQYHVFCNDVSLCSCHTEFSHWHDFLKEYD